MADLAIPAPPMPIEPKTRTIGTCEVTGPYMGKLINASFPTLMISGGDVAEHEDKIEKMIEKGWSIVEYRDDFTGQRFSWLVDLT